MGRRGGGDSRVSEGEDAYSVRPKEGGGTVYLQLVDTVLSTDQNAQKAKVQDRQVGAPQSCICTSASKGRQSEAGLADPMECQKHGCRHESDRAWMWP